MKCLIPNFIYHFEIIDHAHLILGSISLIKLLQPGAGKIITTIGTILIFTLDDLLAVSDLACSLIL